MQENQVLRQLLKSLSGFIGDGAGGLLPKLGWDLNDFNNFVKEKNIPKEQVAQLKDRIYAYMKMQKKQDQLQERAKHGWCS